jgi:hypothetical protein
LIVSDHRLFGKDARDVLTSGMREEFLAVGKNRFDRQRRHAESGLRAGRLIEAPAGLFGLEDDAAAV